MIIGGFILINDRLREAEDFIRSCYRELHKTDQELENRISYIKKELGSKGIMNIQQKN